MGLRGLVGQKSRRCAGRAESKPDHWQRPQDPQRKPGNQTAGRTGRGRSHSQRECCRGREEAAGSKKHFRKLLRRQRPQKEFER